MINFGLILFVVWKFFTNPIIEMLEKRKNQIKNNIEEADELKNELAKQKTTMDNEKEELKASMELQMEALKSDLDKKRKEAEAEIDARRAKMMEEVKKAIDDQKAAIKDDIREEMLEMVKRMVLYIVSNKIPEDVVKSSVTEAWGAYNK